MAQWTIIDLGTDREAHRWDEPGAKLLIRYDQTDPQDPGYVAEFGQECLILDATDVGGAKTEGLEHFEHATYKCYDCHDRILKGEEVERDDLSSVHGVPVVCSACYAELSQV